MARTLSAVFPMGDSSHSLRKCLSRIMLGIFLLSLPGAYGQIERIYLDSVDLNILVDENRQFHLVQIGEYNESLQISPQVQHPDIVQFSPSPLDIPGVPNPNDTAEIVHDLWAYGKSPGHSEVTFNATPAGFVNLTSIYLRVTVMHSNTISVISYIMGWIYFAAWSVSFYPQIYINFRRKSVVGLNFDFLALNVMGFTMYSLFNCGLYFSKAIQDEYLNRHPRSVNPVQLNDVFFSLHAAFATLVTIAQCFMYEREEQRVSMTGRGILAGFGVIVIITAGLGAGGQIEWLDFLYGCSYIKLCITLIKYVPQAYMNYKRKSTVGWSIGNIFLDFVGGFLSILQMALNAYNYNDWISFFGDATKFGLGLFSLIFDVFFILQHYVFYREGREFMIVDSSDEVSNMTSSGEGRDYFMVSYWQARYILLPGEQARDGNRAVQDSNADTPYQGYIDEIDPTQDEPA